MNDSAGCLSAIPIIVFLLAVSFAYGISYERVTFKREAVEAGVAEFYLDEANQKQFRFLSK